MTGPSLGTRSKKGALKSKRTPDEASHQDETKYTSRGTSPFETLHDLPIESATTPKPGSTMDNSLEIKPPLSPTQKAQSNVQVAVPAPRTRISWWRISFWMCILGSMHTANIVLLEPVRSNLKMVLERQVLGSDLYQSISVVGFCYIGEFCLSISEIAFSLILSTLTVSNVSRRLVVSCVPFLFGASLYVFIILDITSNSRAPLVLEQSPAAHAINALLFLITAPLLSQI